MELFTLLDQVATDQHVRLLKHLGEQLAPYLSKQPGMLVLQSAREQLSELAEAAVELEMRGKTPDLIDFGGYTVTAPLKPSYPFDTVYLTRPFTNKLILTVFPTAQLPDPVALWLNMDSAHEVPATTGFQPKSAIRGVRGPAPCIPPTITTPNELISTAILLRESLETSPINPQTTNSLLQRITHPLEEEVGQRFFPPLQIIRSGVDDLLRPESYLVRLPMVPFIASQAGGSHLALLQLETVPSWPDSWRPEESFRTKDDRVTIIGEGINYDIPTLLALITDLVKALTTQGHGSTDYHNPLS
jgi:hypothetical protein